MVEGGNCMALINCTECGNLISDKAYFCISCGFPFFEISLKNISSEVSENIVKDKQENDVDNNEQEKHIYTITEIKNMLGIGINQAYDLTKSNQFPVRHIGKKMVIPTQPFLEWLNKDK